MANRRRYNKKKKKRTQRSLLATTYHRNMQDASMKCWIYEAVHANVTSRVRSWRENLEWRAFFAMERVKATFQHLHALYKASQWPEGASEL